MTEGQVRAIVIAEIKTCFEQISKDVAQLKAESKETREGIIKNNEGIGRIERLLKGDKDFEDEGMAYQVKVAYEYARKNTDSHIVERGLKAIEHYENWEKAGLWDLLLNMADKYKALKWFVAFTGIGTVAGVVNLISMILNHIK